MLQTAEKYINPLTDFGFKRIFGSEFNKELLISFLNAILDGEVDDLPEQAFLNVGTIEDAKAKGKKLLEAAKANA